MILLAAGEGRRLGAATNKVLLPLAGVPVFAWSLRSIAQLEYVDHVVVVARDQDRALIEDVLAEPFGGRDITVVAGGSTRHGSERNALTAIAGPIDRGEVGVVVVHDAARPLAGREIFAAVIQTAAVQGGALPVRPQPGLVPRDPAARREHAQLVGVQTPQAFQARPLLEAHRAADRDGFVGTDTASCVEEYTDLPIAGVPGPATNLKITYPGDVALAERLLHRRPLGPT